MFLDVIDIKSRKNFNNPISVTIKLANMTAIQNNSKSLICNKCYFFPSGPSAYKQYSAIAKDNKEKGYSKSFMCSNSSDFKVSYTLSNLKDYVETLELKCIPNFVDSNEFSQKDKIKNEYILLNAYFYFHMKAVRNYGNIYEYLMQNECYFKNLYNYRHITIIDTSESVIDGLSNTTFPTMSDKYDFIRKKNFSYSMKI